jgi:hypothetical protein
VNLHIRVVRPGHLAVDLVKLVVCAIVFTHGIHRYLYGEIGPLGRSPASVFRFPWWKRTSSTWRKRAVCC